MKTLFLIAFGGGLAIAVYSMLNGVEKKKGGTLSRPKAYFNLPGLASFAICFGAVGYLLLRNTGLSAGWIYLIGFLAAATAWIGMTVLMAKWALRPAESQAPETEEIQGHLAVVVAPLRDGVHGSIRYQLNGVELESPARGIDERTLQAGTDVVIDRFDNEIAVVEAWSSVERRL